MLLQPRMVGRALHRDVERDLHLVLTADFDEVAKVLQRAELRMHGIMPAFLAADRIEAAGIVRTGIERIVLAFAVGAPDRMDRREVEHVEAQRGDFRNACGAILECAVLAWRRALTARPQSSYQAIARARSRSTVSGQVSSASGPIVFGLRHACLDSLLSSAEDCIVGFKVFQRRLDDALGHSLTRHQIADQFQHLPQAPAIHPAGVTLEQEALLPVAY